MSRLRTCSRTPAAGAPSEIEPATLGRHASIARSRARSRTRMNAVAGEHSTAGASEMKQISISTQPAPKPHSSCAQTSPKATQLASGTHVHALGSRRVYRCTLHDQIQAAAFLVRIVQRLQLRVFDSAVQYRSTCGGRSGSQIGSATSPQSPPRPAALLFQVSTLVTSLVQVFQPQSAALANSSDQARGLVCYKAESMADSRS
eukprot:2090699-Rhodomonas_salina.1